MNAASLSELAIVAVILLDLALAASGSLAVCIRLAAAQGVITAVLPLLAGSWPVHPRTLVFSIAVAALKGVVFPWLLTRARLVAKVSKDTGPVIGYPASIMLCILAFAAAAWLGTRLPLPTARIAWIVPASLATIFTGFLLIITRAKAITQVLGYLVMENGIYIFGLALFVEQPMMVEMAILLDIFVAVFVMGITIFHISKEFDHIDTAELSELSDWHPESRRAK